MRPPSALSMRCILALALVLAVALVPPIRAQSQVDINQADAKTLARSLTGVGLVKAEAIVAWRVAHGPFRSIEDLAKVQGIGARTIEANRTMILIVPATPARASPGQP